MKAYKILALTAGLALLSGITGCEKQLDIPQHGAISVEDYYQTDADAESAVANLYTSWRGSFDKRMVLFTLLSDDSMRGGASSNKQAPYIQLACWIFNSGTSPVSSYYEACYNVIYASNLIIDHVKPDTDVKKRIVAEAKFFRGYAHLHLAALWGETVPKVDHLLNPDEYHVTNSQPGEVWALVESDLKDAIAVLPSKNGVNDQTVTRVTKEAAEVYLGKAYLWQKKYSEAKNEFEKVIGSNLYALWDGNFEDMVHVTTNNNCEKVLEAYVQNDNDNVRKNGASDGNGFWATGGFSLNWFSATQEARSTYASGDGFFLPREALYKAFVAEEGENGYRLNASIKTLNQMKGMGLPYNGTDIYFNDGYINWKNRIQLSDLMAPPSGNRAPNNEYINYCYVRYAEVLLLAAEAHLRASDGSQAKADEYVNLVRRRARLADKTNVTIDDVKTEKRLELCFEGVRYMDLIRWQRIEGTHDAYLAMKDQGVENYHIAGVKKAGTKGPGDGGQGGPGGGQGGQGGQGGNGGSANYEKDADGNVIWTKNLAVKYDNAGFKEGKHELLPYPLEEMQVNGENITQNPGWD